MDNSNGILSGLKSFLLDLMSLWSLHIHKEAVFIAYLCNL